MAACGGGASLIIMDDGAMAVHDQMAGAARELTG